MRKAAVAAGCILAMSALLSGCRKEEVEEAIQPLVADVLAEEETESAEEMEEEQVLPQIDTSIPIQAGARIAVVSKSTNGEFWDLIRSGMEQAVSDVNEAYGFRKDDKITMTFEGPSDEQMVEEQINTIDAVISENPDVLCLSVGDMDSCQAQLESARENGIPVIVFDSNVTDTKLVTAFRGTDNLQVGRMAAYRLGRAIGKMGNVAIFSAQEKTESSQNRVSGFLEFISNYSDIKVVQVIYQDQVEDMENAMQEVLEKYPGLDGVFCTNADVADMYLNMEKNEDNGKIAMVGVDCTTRQQEAIKNGEEIGVVSQDPTTMGYQTIWTALCATVEEEEDTEEGSEEDSPLIEGEILLKPVWLCLDNLDDPKYSNYIYN